MQSSNALAPAPFPVMRDYRDFTGLAVFLICQRFSETSHRFVTTRCREARGNRSEGLYAVFKFHDFGDVAKPSLFGSHVLSARFHLLPPRADSDRRFYFSAEVHWPGNLSDVRGFEPLPFNSEMLSGCVNQIIGSVTEGNSRPPVWIDPHPSTITDQPVDRRKPAIFDVTI